jgi:hypothetical protein
MSVPHSTSATRGFGSRRRAGNRASEVNPGLRVSDAERAEVADRLAKHYGDGRLDQAEFDKRLDQAMRAITQSDLSGLFADLPDGGTPEAVARRQHVRPYLPYRRILSYVLLIVITVAVWHALLRVFIPWLLIGLLVFLWLRHGPWQAPPRN